MCSDIKIFSFSDCRVLLRVRMLYYLKQEVIGEHADSILKGADIRYLKVFSVIQKKTQPNQANELLGDLRLIFPCNLLRDVDIWMPDMEQQEVPAVWWDGEADRSLLAGVFKHGILNFYLAKMNVSGSCIYWALSDVCQCKPVKLICYQVMRCTPLCVRIPASAFWRELVDQMTRPSMQSSILVMQS